MAIQVGQSVTVTRVLCQQDFDRFAALSGDDNPIHIDPVFSARTKFGRTVAHGMLLYSTMCGALSTWLPGVVQLEQELMFPNATFVGEQVTIRLKVTQVHAEKGLVDLTTAVIKLDGNPGLQGRTLVRLPGTSPTHPAKGQTDQPTRDSAEQPTLKGLCVGQRAETRRTFTATDQAEYADLTGDSNPIVADVDSARRAGFEGPIIPGGLLGGLFSFLLGTRLPGRGTNYLKQRLEFPAPAYTGQELTAAVEIVRLRPEKQLVNLRTLCYNSDSELVCYGEALVLVSDLERV